MKNTNMKYAKFMAVASAFFCTAAACAAYVQGDSFTVPAGATVTVTDADIADFNALASVTFADAAGVLVFDTSSAPTVPISGEGTIRKSSSAAWTLGTSQSGFTGTWDFAGGTATVSARYALGSESSYSNVCVRSGATLELASSAIRFGYYRTLHLCGVGDGGKGALRLTQVLTANNNSLRQIVLDGDASIAITGTSAMYMQCTSIGNNNSLELNGHALTVSCEGGRNDNMLALLSGRVAGPGRIVVKNPSKNNYGGLCLRGVKLLDPSVEIVLENYTRINIYSHSATNYLAKLTVEGSDCRLQHDHQHLGTPCASDMSHDFWAGEVSLPNSTSRLRLGLYRDSRDTLSARDFALGITGPVTGPGSLYFATVSSWKIGRYYLTCPTNSYTGSTTLDGASGATLVLPCSNNVPVYAKVSSNVPITLTPSGKEHGWGPSSIARFAEGMKCTGDAVSRRVVVDASQLETPRIVFDGIADDLSGDYLDGIAGAPGTELEFRSPIGRPLVPVAVSNSVTLTGSASLSLTNHPAPASNYLYGGDLIVSGAGDLNLAASLPYYIGAAYGAKSMQISNSTWTQAVNTVDFSSATQGATIIGDRNGATYDSPGDLRIGAGAVVTGRFQIAMSDYSRGRLLQTGGKVAVLSSFSNNNRAFSVGGASASEGYCELADGTLDILGAMNIGRYSRGLFRQRGGSFSVLRHPNTTGSSATEALAYFGYGSGSWGHFMTTGGTAHFTGTILAAANSNSRAVLTVGGNASVVCDSEIAYGYEQGSEVIVNLAGSARLKSLGFVSRWEVRDYSSNGWFPKFYLNADGGTLVASRGGSTLLGGPQISNPESRSYPPLDRVALYGGGLTIDVGSYDPTAYGVLTPASGKGVASIPFVGIEGAVASPWVSINGDGHGAAAVVEVDQATGNATGVTVVSPGCDYTWATATIYSGASGATNAFTTVNCVLADNDGSGGLTVKGTSGTLTLTATNTYAGSTTLAGGTLKLGCDRAIPADSTIVLSGGRLIMNGHSLSDGSTMPKNWAIDMNRVRAGGTVTNNWDLAFPDGATLTILNLEDPPEGEHSTETLLYVNGTVSGSPTLLGVDNPRVRVRWKGNRLVKRVLSMIGMVITVH